MSKVGENPIKKSDQVTLEKTDRKVVIKGGSNVIELDIPYDITFEEKDGVVTVSRTKENKRTKALHGLFRSLLANAIIGVEKAWEKRLEVVGTGYNAKLSGENLELKLGFSHPVIFEKIPGITYQVEGNNKIIILGSNKQLVGQVAYQIKSAKKPDAYKGKGIKYEGERLKIKPGKKAKTAGAE